MAGEEVYTASVIAGVGIMYIMFSLSSQAKGNEFWRNTWLAGVFMMILWIMTVIEHGWQHVIVDNQMANLAFDIFTIVMYCMLAVIGWTVLNIFLYTFRKLFAVASGRADYGKTEKNSDY